MNSVVAVGPRLTLEQFAHIAARIDVGAHRDDVLGAVGVSAETWEASQQMWLARMAEQSGAGRHSLTDRYTKLFGEHRKKAAKDLAVTRKPVAGPPPARPDPVRLPLMLHDRPRAAGQTPGLRAPVVPSVRSGAVAPLPGSVPAAPQRAFGPAPASPAQVPLSTNPLGGRGAPAPASAPLPAPARPAGPSPAGPGPAPSGPGAPRFIAAAPAVAAAEPLLTLEQFASLRAELAVSPEPTHAEVRGRYKLDERSWPVEESAWQRRLGADPAMLKRYMQHFQYMRGLLTPR